jgi:hypothetical protein
MGFSLFDVVQLEVDLPAAGLRKGDRGAVVHVFSMPTEAYEIEFTSPEPGELLTETLRSNQISLVWAASVDVN